MPRPKLSDEQREVSRQKRLERYRLYRQIEENKAKDRKRKKASRSAPQPRTPKSAAERCREYRNRKKQLDGTTTTIRKEGQSAPKSAAERCREYRKRKKLSSLYDAANKDFIERFTKKSFGPYCDTCHRLWFEKDLKPANEMHLDMLNKDFTDEDVSLFRECRACKQSLNKGMDASKLIELVKQNEHLYDQSRKDYRDVALRKRTWESIAEAMNCSMDECHKKFRYLRYRLCRLKKLGGAEAASDPSIPNIFKQMMFLWDHLSIKNNSSCPEVQDSSFYVEPVNGIKCEVELIEGEFVEDMYNHDNEESEHSTYVEVSAQNSENSVLLDIEQQETDYFEDESHKELRTTNQELSSFIVQSSNEEFAELVEYYLDQIVDSEKQSSMRLHILNYLHKEIFI